MEECIHLQTTQTCYICSKHKLRDERDAAARRKRFLQLLAAGVIKTECRKTQPTDYTSHRTTERLFEDDYGRYNK